MLVAQNAVRHPLLERLSDARALTDQLFSLVKPEAFYDRPIPERHRIIFYVGHLEAFDWNLLRERILNLKSFHPEFDHLFAFGIDPVDGGLPSDRLTGHLWKRCAIMSAAFARRSMPNWMLQSCRKRTTDFSPPSCSMSPRSIG